VLIDICDSNTTVWKKRNSLIRLIKLKLNLYGHCITKFVTAYWPTVNSACGMGTEQFRHDNGVETITPPVNKL